MTKAIEQLETLKTEIRELADILAAEADSGDTLTISECIDRIRYLAEGDNNDQDA